MSPAAWSMIFMLTFFWIVGSYIWLLRSLLRSQRGPKK